jgi:hypothetical protein
MRRSLQSMLVVALSSSVVLSVTLQAGAKPADFCERRPSHQHCVHELEPPTDDPEPPADEAPEPPAVEDPAPPVVEDPAPPVDDDGCGVLSGETIRLEGEQSTRFRELALEPGTVIDARGASWSSAVVGDRPINMGGGPDICWQGGTITGEYPTSDTWERMHDTNALNVEDPHTTIVGVRVHNYGDAIDLDDAAADFIVRGVWLTQIRDDCIENDQYNTGLLEDSLLDGCYTALSARRNSSDSTTQGGDNLWTIRNSLIRMEPMETVYKGTAPGNGKFWKWDKDGVGVDMALHDNIWRADQPPTSGDYSLPIDYLRSCSNNVMIWLGDGPFPGKLPPCFTITTDPTVWDDAVADWHRRNQPG